MDCGEVPKDWVNACTAVVQKQRYKGDVLTTEGKVY